MESEGDVTPSPGYLILVGEGGLAESSIQDVGRAGSIRRDPPLIAGRWMLACTDWHRDMHSRAVSGIRDNYDHITVLKMR